MLVLKCGIDPRYVMDEMPLYEADIYLSRAYYVGQELREDVRMVTWATAQVNSKKKLRPSDIYKFSWEAVKNDEPAETPDFDRIKAMSDAALKWKKNEDGKRPKIHIDPRSLPV